jgi:hypothetical protein
MTETPTDHDPAQRHAPQTRQEFLIAAAHLRAQGLKLGGIAGVLGLSITMAKRCQSNDDMIDAHVWLRRNANRKGGIYEPSSKDGFQSFLRVFSC